MRLFSFFDLKKNILQNIFCFIGPFLLKILRVSELLVFVREHFFNNVINLTTIYKLNEKKLSEFGNKHKIIFADTIKNQDIQ